MRESILLMIEVQGALDGGRPMWSLGRCVGRGRGGGGEVLFMGECRVISEQWKTWVERRLGQWGELKLAVRWGSWGCGGPLEPAVRSWTFWSCARSKGISGWIFSNSGWRNLLPIILR